MSQDLGKYAITGNSVVDGIILKTILSVAGTMAGYLASRLHINDPDFAGNLVEVVLPVAVAGAAFTWNVMRAKFSRAQAVQAGINLVVTGRAIDNDGNVITGETIGTTPPKPVTTETAKQIVKAFG